MKSPVSSTSLSTALASFLVGAGAGGFGVVLINALSPAPLHGEGFLAIAIICSFLCAMSGVWIFKLVSDLSAMDRLVEALRASVVNSVGINSLLNEQARGSVWAESPTQQPTTNAKPRDYAGALSAPDGVAGPRSPTHNIAPLRPVQPPVQPPPNGKKKD